MEQTLEQQLKKALADLPPEDVQAIVAFARSLQRRRQEKKGKKAEPELSETQYCQIVRVLDAVAALSLKEGPPVSNRDHDRDLYGKD